MSFEIQTIPLNEFELIHLIDNSTHTQVEISTKGALLNSWQIISQTKALELIQGNDFSKGWSNFEMNGFRGGKISPDRKSTRLNSSHTPLSRMPSSA